MTKQEAKIFNSNLEAGYKIYAEPYDTKTPTAWKERRRVVLVVETTKGSKRGKNYYPQTSIGQEELSRAVIELHKLIYNKRSLKT